MKKFIKLNLILLLFVFNIPQIKTQEATNKISFINLGKNKGYLIDSLENLSCKCIPNATGRFRYAALLQMPDSAVVLRIKKINVEGFVDEKMTENKLTDFYNRKLNAKAKKSLINLNEEEQILKQIAGDSIKYQLIDLNEFKLPDYLLTKTFIYVNLGLGYGKFQNIPGLARGIEAGLIYKKNIFSIRTNGVADIFGSMMAHPTEKSYDYGLLYGRYINCKKTMITFSSGIACTKRILRGEFISSSGGLLSETYYETITLYSIGLPVQIAVLFGTNRNPGLSLQAFANLNEKYPFGGLICCLRIGKIRNSDFSIY